MVTIASWGLGGHIQVISPSSYHVRTWRWNQRRSGGLPGRSGGWWWCLVSFLPHFWVRFGKVRKTPSNPLSLDLKNMEDHLFRKHEVWNLMCKKLVPVSFHQFFGHWVSKKRWGLCAAQLCLGHPWATTLFPPEVAPRLGGFGKGILPKWS